MSVEEFEDELLAFAPRRELRNSLTMPVTTKENDPANKHTEIKLLEPLKSAHPQRTKREEGSNRTREKRFDRNYDTRKRDLPDLGRNDYSIDIESAISMTNDPFATGKNLRRTPVKAKPQNNYKAQPKAKKKDMRQSYYTIQSTPAVKDTSILHGEGRHENTGTFSQMLMSTPQALQSSFALHDKHNITKQETRPIKTAPVKDTARLSNKPPEELDDEFEYAFSRKKELRRSPPAERFDTLPRETEIPSQDEVVEKQRVQASSKPKRKSKLTQKAKHRTRGEPSQDRKAKHITQIQALPNPVVALPKKETAAKVVVQSDTKKKNVRRGALDINIDDMLKMKEEDAFGTAVALERTPIRARQSRIGDSMRIAKSLEVQEPAMKNMGEKPVTNAQKQFMREPVAENERKGENFSEKKVAKPKTQPQPRLISQISQIPYEQQHVQPIQLPVPEMKMAVKATENATKVEEIPENVVHAAPTDVIKEIAIESTDPVPTAPATSEERAEVVLQTANNDKNEAAAPAIETLHKDVEHSEDVEDMVEREEDEEELANEGGDFDLNFDISQLSVNQAGQPSVPARQKDEFGNGIRLLEEKAYKRAEVPSRGHRGYKARSGDAHAGINAEKAAEADFIKCISRNGTMRRRQDMYITRQMELQKGNKRAMELFSNLFE